MYNNIIMSQEWSCEYSPVIIIIIKKPYYIYQALSYCVATQSTVIIVPFSLLRVFALWVEPGNTE